MTKSPYSTITATGPDAAGFLQGQLTNDIDRLADRTRLLSAWCNPKGRVICVMQVLPLDGGFALVLPSGLAEDVLKRLLMFRFRAKVELASRAASDGEIGLDGRSVEEWLLERLRAGIPEVHREQSEQYTAHMLNLDLLDALSLEKGCYTGQEVIARTHYRGASKRRMFGFESASPLPAGARLSNGDREIGEVVNAIGTELLAVVPIDEADAELTAAGVALTRRPLPYL